SSSFSVAAQLTTPNTPTVTTAAATCSAVGTATINGYNGALTYTFTPVGPTAGAGGAISGMTAGTSYTVTAGNGSCTSIASSSFSIAAQLTIPSIPTVTTALATCSAAGTATITNYDGGLTYAFSPSGPTAGALGAITGMTAGTSYTVTAGNGSCASAASSSFSVAAQLTTPTLPTVTTTAATCSVAGTATISNYNAGQTYTFTPAGPTAGALGAITGMTSGTSYTVTAGNGSCTSAASSSFSIAAQLTTPSVPTVTTAAATCSAAGTATITNYDGGLTYAFSPSGPTAGALGAIIGMTAVTSYTVIAGNGSCTSTASSSFSIAAQLTTPTIPTVTTAVATCSAVGTATISNYNVGQTYTFTPSGPTAGALGAITGMTAGTSYTVTAGNGSCTSTASSAFSIAAQLTTPTIPTVTTAVATCSAAGTATITNYDGGLTYAFSPSGPTAGALGAITGMTAGTSYTVIAGNGSCTSTASSSFSFAAQLTTPSVPTVTTTPATCSGTGTATITNYDGGLTYAFSPSGPTAGALGAITGMTAGTSYTVTAGNGSCTSLASSSFSIAAQLTTPSVPTVTTTAATCSAAGTATISGYNGSLTYTFTPAGPSAGAGGSITGMTAGTSYTVTAGNGSCTSVASSSFSIAAQLSTPSVPTVSTAAATCSAAGTATISGYNGALTYTFSPTGPSAGTGGVISGMTAGTSYTVTAGNGSCTSVASSSFSIAAQLSTPSVPTVSTAAATCSAAGTATITNYSGSLTYTFSPSGPSAGIGGVISGMSGGTSYILTAGNISCTSAASSSFSIAVPLCGPTANDNSTTTNEDTPVVLTSIQSNDTDSDGNVVTSTIDLDPTTPGQQTTLTTSNGIWTLNTSTGDVSFTPSANFNGTATISYTIQDNSGLTSNAANLTVTVNAINDTPNAVNDVTSTNEDTPVVIDVTNNDTDTDGSINDASVTVVSNPTNGTVTVNPITGEVTYTPNAGFNGTDSFTYSVCDNGTPLPAQCDQATVTITINAVNDAPNAADDFASTNEDTPVVIDVTNNDTDTDGAINDASVTIVSNPTNGTVTVNPTTGEVTYTPNAGFNGTDSFTYSVCDNGTPLPVQCDQATVNVTINAVNDTPNAVDDVASTNEDTPVVIDVTNNDTDTDGSINDASVTVVSNPTNGTTTVNPITGEVTYTPNAGFNGTDSFTYSVCDNGTPLPAQCDQATVNITVNAVNDSPIVDNDSNTILEDGGPATGDLTDAGDSDPDGTPLTVDTTPVSGPNNGSITINSDGTYSYTPNAGFNGQDTIIVSVCDSGLPLPAICVNDTLIITVTPVNDSPIVDNDSNTIPEDGGPATGDLTDAGDSDPDGTPLTVDTTPVSGPSNGSITINTDGTYSYTPNAGFNGQDTIIVSVCDNGLPLPAICVNDTLIITVTPVNDAPNATADNITTNENITVTINVTNNDNDSDGNIDESSLTITDQPTNGSVTVNPTTGQITYTPNSGFTGTDTLIYQICDNGTPLPAVCDTAMVVITVLSCGTDLTADCDGDGVTNGQEIDPDGDGSPGPNGTNPSDPCSFNTADQDLALVSQAWLDADCDGDGVTNGEEVDPDGDGIAGPNGTNPSDPCSFDVANQDLGSVSQAWLDADCDGDGVTNGDEVDPDGDGIAGPNGTNPSDPCSFDVANQDLGSVSQAWLDADCDGDGVTNGDEVDPDGDGIAGPNGTNPSDPCSFDVTNQELGSVSQAWLDVDCDGDGASNGDEVDPDGDGIAGPNGTNPSDPCSFDVANQDLGSVSQAWLDADCDGDGATNGEEVDPDGDGIAGPNGTDPSDPCSFDVANQDLGSVSQAWLDADCDGDGVTNGDEVDPDGDGIAGPNGTDPSDPCSFDVANQDLGSVSQAWLNADCDGDGVTNGQEIIDGTDPNNPCSLVVASQTETPSQAWLDADCDGDGLTNGVEVSGGSNPFDPCDPNSCDSDITIPQAFTPDGDNTNDTFVIPGIENYPKNKLTIYNRWGNEVFFAEGYNNTWNGTANRGIVIGDAQLPTGTYYYILDLNGDGETIYKGYVYLKR
ncbi:MAG: tandem-95 repeat protein, partial [Crocinitomicaceae bacterium]|nr:tandem-95 repeat protein [Crocinitomicaceae bacterium]